MSEADITINGRTLTIGQSMTVRCAIESFAASLVTDGVGEDEDGKALAAGYLARIEDIRGMIFGGSGRMRWR